MQGFSVLSAQQPAPGEAQSDAPALGASRARVLMVEDDDELGQMMAEFMQDEPFDLTLAHDGVQALALLASQSFDLLLLDVMLPGISGFDLLRHVRGVSSTPVIMLTARTAYEDCIEGLELGADDYVGKPFNPGELAARMRAVLRRGAARDRRDADALDVGPLRVMPQSQEAFFLGQPMGLTAAELRVLEVLMRHAGRPVDREQLTQFALGRGLEPFDRSLDTHVSNLRRKLRRAAPDGGCPEIRGLRNFGYILALDGGQ